MAGGLSHHRRRDVALLGQGTLLFSLQGHPASMDFAQCGEPGGIREIRQNADHSAGGDARGHWHSGFHPDHRRDGEALSGAVDPSRRPRRALHLGADRGIRRRVGQQMDVSLPLGPRCRPDLLGGTHRADARTQRPSEEKHDGVRRPGPRPHGRSGVVRRLQRRDRAADRGRFYRHAGAARRSSRDAALSVRRTAGLWRFWPLGPDSTKCGPTRPRAR